MMSYKNERYSLFRSLCTFECYRNSFLFFDISFPPENIVFSKHLPPKVYMRMQHETEIGRKKVLFYFYVGQMALLHLTLLWSYYQHLVSYSMILLWLLLNSVCDIQLVYYQKFSFLLNLSTLIYYVGLCSILSLPACTVIITRVGKNKLELKMKHDQSYETNGLGGWIRIVL